MLRMMTSDPQVVEASRAFLPWLLLMPPIGCAAFTWDGIYIGATASKAIRNSMLWAVAGFAAVWAVGISCLDLSASGAMHLLMAAYQDYEGFINYDETELTKIGSAQLYEMESIIQQNVFIFNATILENITMFREFPKEQVEALLS